MATLSRVTRGLPEPLVVCGDFNVARDSTLFAWFVDAAGLTDVFAGSCPPTFRAEYLPAGAEPHCIDFVLTSREVTAEAATVLFGGKVQLRDGPGYASDHLGLSARICLVPSGA